MATNIVVPEMGDSIVEATIVKWLKKEGDSVSIGEPIVELETEKANFEVAAEKAGVIENISKKEEEDVNVGDVIGTIVEGAVTTAPALAQKDDKTNGKDKPPTVEEPAEDSGIKITPVARNIAEEHNIDLLQVPGTGINKKITKEDVEIFIQEKTPVTEQTPEPVTPLVSDKVDPLSLFESIQQNREERIKMTRRRRTIARRMLEAQQNAAILSTFNELDMGSVMDLRKRKKDDFKEKHGVSLGLSSFFVKACIGALKEFPYINAEIQGEEIIKKNYYDICMAIGADEGLVVPVIRDADRLTFAQIEHKVREYAQKANEGKLTLEDMMGGSFTISNGGIFGSLMSTPIINPPQVGILGLHKIEQRPVVIEGEIVIRPMMYVALSYDHRIVDGKNAVQFLVMVKELIEDPEALLIEG